MEISLCANLYHGKPLVPYAKNSVRDRTRKFIFTSCKASNSNNTNFYELLNLSSSNAGIDEIKKAYRTKALKYHPDSCHSSMKEDSTKLFVRLHEAYRVLSDPVLREQYDYKLNMHNSTRNYKIKMGDDQVARKRWEEQLHGLKRQTSNRAMSEEGSWGSRMRDRKVE